MAAQGGAVLACGYYCFLSLICPVQPYHTLTLGVSWPYSMLPNHNIRTSSIYHWEIFWVWILS